MDVVKFLKEKNRMCGAVRCTDCPLAAINNGIGVDCNRYLVTNIEESMAKVKTWATENPREIDWFKVPAGTDVLVRNITSSNWVTKVFACYLPKGQYKFVTFSGYCCRDDVYILHENADCILSFKYCKLADNVNPEPYYKD